MKDESWEDLIALNSRFDGDFTALDEVAAHVGAVDLNQAERDSPGIRDMIAGDKSPLPATEDREAYMGDDHFAYWKFGLDDYQAMATYCKDVGLDVAGYFDLGCASGRVLRHFVNPAAKVRPRWVGGCDINRKHVEWIESFLVPEIKVFQNSSIPVLPLEENSVDLISAFSVFSHIESFESTWLLEMRRVLRPGGLLWVSYHSEETWATMEESRNPFLFKAVTEHPDFAAMPNGFGSMPKEKLVFRWRSDRSYSANVFYSTSYLRSRWGRFFESSEVLREAHSYQDVIVLRK